MKRLIVCCDGTWQQLANPYPSNIVKLAQSVKPIASDGVPQIVFYDEGVGTEEHSGLSDTALQWMMDATRELGLGLEFDPSVIPTGINPNYECDFKNDPGFFKLAGIKFREVGDGIEDLHESTIKRLQVRKDYRPKNLEKVLPKLIQTLEK